MPEEVDRTDVWTSNDVTSSQCVRIVKEISYTPDQVEMMKKLYPYVRDKQNFNKVIDSLFSTVYKDEMYKFIKEYHQTNNDRRLNYEANIIFTLCYRADCRYDSDGWNEH